MNDSIKNFIRLFVAILLLIILLRWIGIEKIVTTLKTMDLRFIPVIILIFVVNLIIGTANIFVLLTPIKKGLSFAKLLRYYLIAWSVGLFIPGKVGEFMLIYFFKKDGISLGEGSVVYILDKIITLAVLGPLAVIGAFIFLPEYVLLITSLFAGLGILLIFFVFMSSGRNLLKKYIFRKLADKFGGFSDTLKMYFKKEKKILALNLGITLIKVLGLAYIVYITFLSFGINPGFVNVTLATAFKMIVAFIPITMAGLGIREVTEVLLYKQIMVPEAITINVSLIMLALIYIAAGIFIPLLMRPADFVKIKDYHNKIKGK